jgi:hypothetical protein
MKRTFHGSCHCGAVGFECEADLAAGTSKCNCSICAKSRFWKVVVPASDFRLLRGNDALAVYTFGGDTGAGIRHHFCSACGIKPFGMGEHEALGGKFYGVNIACIDDLSDAERAALPVKFEDGRNNRWEDQPAETRYL